MLICEAPEAQSPVVQSVCVVCAKKVKPELRWPHRMSASLDHIVPISKGGAHIKSNVRCAHLSCNSKKHNGPGGQMLLFG